MPFPRPITAWSHGTRRAALAVAALLAVGLAGIAESAGPATDDLASVVSRIEAAYRNTKELQADFVQTTHYEGFSTPYISKGRLSIRRPALMRWSYSEPSHHQIFVNGDTVIYFVPEHQQAIRSTMDREVQSPVPLMLLADVAALSKQFSINWAAGTEGPAKGRYQLTLTGKEAAAALAPMTIAVDAGTHLIQTVTLHDPSGAETTYEFSHLTLNTKLDDALFVFTPPPGVDVVDAPPLLSPNAPEPKSELK